jgi:uncharacterized protein YgiB involved in biofilm formation
MEFYQDMKIILALLLVTFFYSPFVMAGCAADKKTGTVYCSKGDCAADGGTGTVYCAKNFGGGAAIR